MLAFWEMTPRETLAEMDAALWRSERVQEQSLSQAWHTAALQRVGRMPALKNLLARLKPSAAAAAPIEDRRREFEEQRRRFAKVEKTLKR